MSIRNKNENKKSYHEKRKSKQIKNAKFEIYNDSSICAWRVQHDTNKMKNITSNQIDLPSNFPEQRKTAFKIQSGLSFFPARHLNKHINQKEIWVLE